MAELFYQIAKNNLLYENLKIDLLNLLDFNLKAIFNEIDYTENNCITNTQYFNYI